MFVLRWKHHVPVSNSAGDDDGRCRHNGHGRFLTNASGEVAIVFGLMAAVSLMSIGAAVDFARFLNARDQTMAAIDSAILAGARSLQIDASQEASALALAKQYYEQAIKNRPPLRSDTVRFAVVDSGTAMVASGDAKIATPFMGLAGFPELPLLTWSAAAAPKAIVASGGNAQSNLEIAVMLDTSNTMANASGAGSSKIADMKAAASDLVNIVVWNDQSAFTSRVALVPFSGDVRIPPAWLINVRDPAAAASKTVIINKEKFTYWKTPCFGERMGTNSSTDAPPGAGNYVLSVYSFDRKCSQAPLDNEIVALSSDKTLLLDRISKLTVGVGSAGHVGTAWAYYMLSPNWSAVLPVTSTPAAYGAAKTNKVIVLMTDGAFNFTHDSNGIATAETGGNANGVSSADQAIAVCSDMKRNGIQVYTVGFDIRADQTAINTLMACASDTSKFYDATDGSKLKAAFRDIALHVSALHLAN
jgi:Flp pilus assembly protein TadG